MVPGGTVMRWLLPLLFTVSMKRSNCESELICSVELREIKWIESKGKMNYFRSVGGCFAEIDDVDVDIHFFELFGHLQHRRSGELQALVYYKVITRCT